MEVAIGTLNVGDRFRYDDGRMPLLGTLLYKNNCRVRVQIEQPLPTDTLMFRDRHGRLKIVRPKRNLMETSWPLECPVEPIFAQVELAERPHVQA
jgi:hypothetical protein